MADFVDAIRQGAPPESNLVISYDVVRLAEAAEASMVEGGERVALTDTMPVPL